MMSTLWHESQQYFFMWYVKELELKSGAWSQKNSCKVGCYLYQKDVFKTRSMEKVRCTQYWDWHHLFINLPLVVLQAQLKGNFHCFHSICKYPEQTGEGGTAALREAMEASFAHSWRTSRVKFSHSSLCYLRRDCSNSCAQANVVHFPTRQILLDLPRSMAKEA